MNLYILDPAHNRIGMCDNYKSFIWTPRYFEPGDFELYAPASEELLVLLSRDNLIQRETDPTHAMIIESVELLTSAEDGDYVVARGRCLKSILGRRIIWSQTNLNGTVAYGISRLISENLISPSDPSRKVDGFTLGTMQGGTEAFSAQFTGDNLLEAVVGICRSYGLGFDVTLGSGGSLVFTLYKGADRSYEQNQNPHVVFSPSFDNLVDSDYLEDGKEYRNVAKVAGEGEGTDRRMVATGDLDATGLDRYELFVDARDLSSNDGEITEEAYNAMLAERGMKDLKEYETTVGFSGSVLPNRSYQLGTDYNLGDIVEVVNNYGVEGRARITEIIECADENGAHIMPTFESIYTEREYWVDEEGAFYVDETRKKYVLK